jgi:hypothetical protein
MKKEREMGRKKQTENTEQGEVTMSDETKKTRKPVVRLKNKPAADWKRTDDNKVLAMVERVLGIAPTSEIRKRIAKQAVEVCQDAAYEDAPLLAHGDSIEEELTS